MNHKGLVFISIIGMTFTSCESLGFTPRTAPAAATLGGAQANTSNTSGKDVQPGYLVDANTPSSENTGSTSTATVQVASASSSGNGTAAIAGSQVTATKSVNSTQNQGSDASDVSGLLNAASESVASSNPNQNQIQEMCSSATAQISNARTAMMYGRFQEAVSLAGAASICGAQIDELFDIAMVSATRVDPSKVFTSFGLATTPIERAAYGLEAIRICAGNNDKTCINAVKDDTFAALNLLGKGDVALSTAALLETSPSTRPVVAVALPLSGRDRKMGRAMLGALLQAGGIYSNHGLAWDFKLFDTQSDASKVPAIISEASTLGAKLVLGPLDVTEAQAAANAVSANNMTLLSFAPNAAFVNDRAFQLSYGVETEAKLIAQTIKNENFTKVVSAYPEGRYGDLITSQVVAAGAAVTTITYETNKTDLRGVAKKIIATKADALFMPTDAASAERLLSFMAQENVWCQSPSKRNAKYAKNDTRQWIQCIAPSSWAPVPATSDYKFVQNARYLDYAGSVPDGENIAIQFEKLYHRAPNVYEIMPFAAVNVLNKLDASSFNNSAILPQSVVRQLGGKTKLLVPTFVEVVR